MTAGPGSTSSTVDGCSPYFAVKDNPGTGYLCVTNVVPGVRTDSTNVGVCTVSGLAYRPLGDTNQGFCVDASMVVAGDLVFSQLSGTTTAQGGQICAASGLAATEKVAGGNTYVACTGTRAPLSVSDSGTHDGLSQLTTATSQPPAAAEPKDLTAVVWSLGLVGVAALCVLIFLVATHVFGRLAS